jgi:hypothetical protein
LTSFSFTSSADWQDVNSKAKTKSECKSIEDGSLWLVLTNNNQYWKCRVIISSKTSDYIDSLDTGHEPQLVQVPYGTYDIKIQALNDLLGVNTSIVIKKVEVKSADPVSVQHDFKSALFELIPRLGEQNIDCEIAIKEDSTWQTVAIARSYEVGSRFLLNPGNYRCKVVALGDHQYLDAQLIKIRISQGYDFTKVVIFQE